MKSNKEINKVEKIELGITKEHLRKLSDDELNKVAGGFNIPDNTPVAVICPPGCKYIQNACNCD